MAVDPVSLLLSSLIQALGRGGGYLVNWMAPLAIPTQHELLSAWRRGDISNNAAQIGLQLNGAYVTDLDTIRQGWSYKNGLLDYSAPGGGKSVGIWSQVARSQQAYPPLHWIFQLLDRGHLTTNALEKLVRGNDIVSNDLASAILQLRFQVPPITDLIRFAVREAFAVDKNPRLASVLNLDAEYDEQSEAAIWARAQGLTNMQLPDGTKADWPRMYWRAHWQLPAPTQVFEMLHRLRNRERINRLDPKLRTDPVDLETVRTYLRAADYAPFWRDKLAAISYRQLGRIEIRMALRHGTIGRDEAVELYKDFGLSDRDANISADTVIKRNEFRPTAPTLIRWRAADLITADRFNGALADLGWAKEWVDVARAEVRSKRRAKVGKIGRPVLLRAYRTGALTDDQIRDTLVKQDFTELEAITILDGIKLEDRIDMVDKAVRAVRAEYHGGVIDLPIARGRLDTIGVHHDARERLIRRWDLELTRKRRQLSATEIIDMAARGLIQVIEARRRLSNLGYQLADQDLLLLRAEQNQQLAAAKAQLQASRDAQAASRAADSQAKAAEAERRRARAEILKWGTPAVLQRWIKRGLLDGQSAYERLRRGGISDDDARRIVAEATDAAPPA